MKTFKEWKKVQNLKTITITCKDIDNTLENMLKYVKSIGNMGHSFPIDVDGKKFEWDGDGADKIIDIKID